MINSDLYKKIESFLKSYYYILSVALVSYIIWLLRFFIKDDLNLLYLVTFLLLFIVSIVFAGILFLFKNTIYTIPIALNLLFTIGITGMGVETFSTTSLILVSLAITTIIGSIFVHIIKFRPKVKLNTLGLSYILVSISFLIPIIYRSDNSNSVIAFLGLVYLIVYLFYSNTLEKDNLNYLFRTLLVLSIVLSLQLVSCFIQNFELVEDSSFKESLVLVFSKIPYPGWGNVNDLTILLTLFSSSIIYYMHKYPKKIIFWIYLAFISIIIVLSGSRGSTFTSILLWIVIAFISIKNKGNGMLKNLLIMLACGLVFLGVFYNFTYKLLDDLFRTIGNIFSDIFKGNVDLKEILNNVSSGRLELYSLAIDAFKQNALTVIFGTGWGDIQPDWFEGGARIVVYHSTFFHALAISGLTGIAILFYQFYKTFAFLIKPKHFAKTAILITYTLTQLHGLIDNTQYMMIYTTATIIMISVLEAYDRSVIEIDEPKLNLI